jgi:hypothetical protein
VARLLKEEKHSVLDQKAGPLREVEQQEEGGTVNIRNMRKLKSYWNKLMYWLMFKNYNE